jgi:hypothetical protein
MYVDALGERLRNYISIYIHIHIYIYIHIYMCVYIQEIEDVCRRIRGEAEKLGEEHGPIVVYPLYSSLPPKQQQDIFLDAPAPRQIDGILIFIYV